MRSVVSYSPTMAYLLSQICNNIDKYMSHIIFHKPGYVSHIRWPWISSNKGRASIRKGHCTEKDTWTLFTPVTTSLCIDPFPIYLHDWRRSYHNDKESMRAGMASIHRTHKKVLWPVMRNQTRQPEVWLIAYRMSEKWVTRVGGLILVSELQKNKRTHAYHCIHRDHGSLSADADSIGGREHW